jgi:hypothetical protein
MCFEEKHPHPNCEAMTETNFKTIAETNLRNNGRNKFNK